jgi:hypothetical protein
VLPTFSLRIPIAAAIAATTLLAAGCGGGSPSSGGASSSAGPAGGPPQGFVADAYKYSRCMRQNGVSSFPDPKVTDTAGHQSIALMMNPTISGSPQFATASKACAGIMPAPSNSNAGGSPAQVAAHLKGMLSFATCMRKHQVASFPDPNSQGQITPSMLSGAGLNLHAPAVDAAARTCAPASDGQISQAAVQRAINGGP